MDEPRSFVRRAVRELQRVVQASRRMQTSGVRPWRTGCSFGAEARQGVTGETFCTGNPLDHLGFPVSAPTRPDRPIASTSQPLKASPAALAVLPDIVDVPFTIIRTSEAFHRLRVTADLESLADSLEAEGAP